MPRESLGAYHSTDITLSAHQKSRCPPALQVQQRISFHHCNPPALFFSQK